MCTLAAEIHVSMHLTVNVRLSVECASMVFYICLYIEDVLCR